jgi:precorrin-6A/cobalt-precorrin-6A reductase
MAERIEAMIDATHPFAARISQNAVAAAHSSRISLGSIVRPPWTAQAGDRWMSVESAQAAACSLGARPARVFLTIGRRELAAFKAAPMHSYVVRAVDAPAAEDLLPATEVILQRGPFDEASEEQLLRERGIEIVVAKNSGGDATYAKIAAARRLGLPIVMVARPPKPKGVALPDAVAAHAWLVSLVRAHDAASERGV